MISGVILLSVVHISSCCSVNGDQVSLMLWDTAGQEEYDAITRAYYRGAHPLNAMIFNSLRSVILTP